MAVVIQLDLKYLEDLYDFLINLEREDERFENITQLKSIIKYGKISEQRLLKRCERCPLNKRKDLHKECK